MQIKTQLTDYDWEKEKTIYLPETKWFENQEQLDSANWWLANTDSTMDMEWKICIIY